MHRLRLGHLAKYSLVVGFIAASLLVSGTPQAEAQQDVSRELEQIKRSLADLQRYIYNGQQGPAPALSTQQSGSTSAIGSDDSAARLQVQIQELERLVRQMTGKAEELDFRIRQLEGRLDTALNDIDFRLTQLEGGTPAPQGSGNAAGGETGAQQLIPVPGAAAENTPASGSTGTTVISSEGTQVTGAATSPATGGTLGSLVVDANGNVIGGQINPSASIGSTPGSGRQQVVIGGGSPPTPQTVTPAAPVESAAVATASAAAPTELPNEPKALYDFSLGLMRQGAYADAESALRVFLDRHSENDLVGAALYWLGETLYVRDDYREAAFAFVDVYSKHPKSNKAPDSLLKLGMSLQSLGSTAEACSAFATLKSEYPDARRAVLKLAEDRSAEYGC